MSQELVVFDGNTEVTPYTEPSYEADVEESWGEPEDVAPQYISLKQPTTENADHIPNGAFYHRASGQVWSSLEMVILKMGPTRDLKPSAPKFVAGEKSICRSINGKTPLQGENLVPQAKDCNNCKKNSWEGYDKKTGEGPKPLCQAGFNFLFVDAETSLPYIYNNSGKAVKASEALRSAMHQRAVLVKAKTKRMPFPWEFVVTMTSEKDGKYYKPKFALRQLTPQDAAKFGPLYQQYVVNYKKRFDTREQETEDDTYDASGDTGAVIDAESLV